MAKDYMTEKMLRQALTQGVAAPAQPSQDAIAIVNNLGRMLQIISNQIGTLIEIEVGVQTREDVRDQILSAVAEMKLMETAAASTEDEAGDAADE